MKDTFKVKIKNWGEINRTLDGFGNHKIDRYASFNNHMKDLCGMCLNAVATQGDSIYEVYTTGNMATLSSWSWHRDWFEYVDEKFTEEDYWFIGELDQMLEYILEKRS